MPQTNIQAEDLGQSAEQLDKLLMGLAFELCQKFMTYAGKRHEKETEWRRAIEQNEGNFDEADREKIRRALGEEAFNRANVVNITRPKTNVAKARLQDIQFPLGGDYNFTMKPLPVSRAIMDALQQDKPTPEMQTEFAVAGMQPQDAPSPKSLAEDILLEQIESARLMTRTIRADLTKAAYGTEARRAISDLCELGTAVVKGPFPEHKEYTAYEEDDEGNYNPYKESKIIPSVTRVDPRMFYPDPSAREEDEVEDCFEIHLLSRSDLIEMASSPAFMEEQIKKVLDAGTNEQDAPSIIQTTSYSNIGLDTKNRFVAHEYHGNLPKEILFEAGVIDQDELEDSTKEFYGQCWFVDKHIIRLSLPIIHGAPRRVYHISTYERDPGSVFGHGVPYLLRNAQRIINQTYLMLMDNAALTSGPQIVMNKEMIEPAGRTNDYTLRPHKVWHLTEYGADVREAMQFVNVPAQSDVLANVIDMAMRFADIESSIPLMQQGEIPVGNNTSMGGLATVTSALSIVQKQASLRWDDHITKPLIEAFYHFNMQYNEDNGIKSNMRVEIGGATERIDAQMRGQDIERILGLSQANPDFSDQIDPSKAFRELVANSRAGDILRPAAEAQELIEQRKAQEAEAAAAQNSNLRDQAAMMDAQTRQMEAQFNQQKAQQEMQFNMERAQAEMVMRQREVEARNAGNMVTMQQATQSYEVEMAKLAQAADLTMQELENRLQVELTKRQTAQDKIMGDLEKQNREIEVKMQFGEGL